jgi:hypothetical protein|nr:MAG TPA: hypothetical protein [Caudoviricetes sp.]
MKHFEDVIHCYCDRIAAIRHEATAEIIALLKKQNLTTLPLSEDEDHLSYVVWFDDNGCGYDCIVKSVTIDEDKDIELELYHHDLDYPVTVTSKYSGILDVGWLPDILSSMVYTLTSKQQSDGK